MFSIFNDCIKFKNRLPNGKLSNNAQIIKMFLTIRVPGGRDVEAHFHNNPFTGEGVMKLDDNSKATRNRKR